MDKHLHKPEYVHIDESLITVSFLWALPSEVFIAFCDS